MFGGPFKKAAAAAAQQGPKVRFRGRSDNLNGILIATVLGIGTSLYVFDEQFFMDVNKSYKEKQAKDAAIASSKKNNSDE